MNFCSGTETRRFFDMIYMIDMIMMGVGASNRMNLRIS
jgi:hypothetical protein